VTASPATQVVEYGHRSQPLSGPRLDFLFRQARLAFASVVAYSRINSTLLPLQGAESIGAYAWRFDDGSPLFTGFLEGLFSEILSS
jgi:hypothetical protein